MTASLKAALFSAFICPGAGHFLLKCYRRSVALFAISILALGVMLTQALQQVTVLADKIANGEIPLDPQIISDKVHAAASGDGSMLSTMASWLFLVVWITGIVDAYRIGQSHTKKTG